MIEWITNIDLSILEFIQKNIRCDFLDAIVPPITHLAEKGIFWIAVALILICFKKTRKTGFMVGAALLIGLALGNGVLKNVVGRIRPYDLDGSLLKEADLLVSGLSDFSFPSGHTLS